MVFCYGTPTNWYKYMLSGVLLFGFALALIFILHSVLWASVVWGMALILENSWLSFLQIVVLSHILSLYSFWESNYMYIIPFFFSSWLLCSFFFLSYFFLLFINSYTFYWPIYKFHDSFFCFLLLCKVPQWTCLRHFHLCYWIFYF